MSLPNQEVAKDAKDESREESLEVGRQKSLQRWEAKNESRHRCKVSAKPETISRFLFKSLTQVETFLRESRLPFQADQ